MPNPDHALTPGVYCTVELKIPRKTPSLIVPSEAIIFNRDGLSVAVVEDGVARIHQVTVVRDFGTTVEVSAGVKDGDQVILNPPVDLIDGRKVNVRPPRRPKCREVSRGFDQLGNANRQALASAGFGSPFALDGSARREDIERITARRVYLADEDRAHELVIVLAEKRAIRSKRDFSRQRVALQRAGEHDLIQGLLLIGNTAPALERRHSRTNCARWPPCRFVAGSPRRRP